MRSLATLGVDLVMLDDYWRPDRDQRTDVGTLVHRAKDQGDPGAAAELADRFSGLAETPDGCRRLVVPVPPTLAAADATGGSLLVDVLARSLAAAGAGEYRGDLVVRTAATPRLRHVDPQQRTEIAASAGYRASDTVARPPCGGSRRRDPDRRHRGRGGGLPAECRGSLCHRRRGCPNQASLRAAWRSRRTALSTAAGTLRSPCAGAPSGPRERPAKP